MRFGGDRSFDKWAHSEEGRAALAAGHGISAVIASARQAAMSGAEDEAACQVLRAGLPKDREPVGKALARLADLRVNYLEDRAFRLLQAASTDSPVQPIDAQHRELYLEEARLGRMPLAEAFAYLAALEPRLTQRVGPVGRLTVGLGELVGPRASSPHPLLRTDLAIEIVTEYLKARREGAAITEDLTPFFERPRRAFTGTFFTFGGGLPDTR
jgi:hypothetical protein